MAFWAAKIKILAFIHCGSLRVIPLLGASASLAIKEEDNKDFAEFLEYHINSAGYCRGSTMCQALFPRLEFLGKKEKKKSIFHLPGVSILGNCEKESSHRAFGMKRAKGTQKIPLPSYPFPKWFSQRFYRPPTALASNLPMVGRTAWL